MDAGYPACWLAVPSVNNPFAERPEALSAQSDTPNPQQWSRGSCSSLARGIKEVNGELSPRVVIVTTFLKTCLGATIEAVKRGDFRFVGQNCLALHQ